MHAMTPLQRKQFSAFIRDLVLAASSMALYSQEHRTTIERASKALAFLDEAMADVNSVTAMFLGNELFVNGTPLEKDPQLDRLMRETRKYGIGHIVFERGATYEDIVLLLRIITGQAERDFPATPHLRFGSVEVEKRLPEESQPAIPTYSAIPQHLLKRLMNAYESCAQGEQIDLDAIMALIAGFVTAFRGESNPLLALVPLRQMDEYTFNHSLNVSILNLAQGMSLGFTGQLLHDIGIAGMLHDVGKLLVPKEILNKPGSLDREEWEQMQLHSVRGAEYLLNTPGVPRLAVITAFENHMKSDLSGYPKVPPDWQINLCSQITMVSDCFDALRIKRVYHEASDFAQTAGMMLKMAGTGLNQALTFNFIRILRKMGEEWVPGNLTQHPPLSIPVS
jgi:HD-GYP domain-containing protein (c-di-GMP phosphodiesterase class II)